jgi:hypothetical protein
MNNNDNPIIGYSAFILIDECYEYNENACYVADSPESLKAFLKDGTFNGDDYRVDKIHLNDILNDFGGSCGEFAMEPEALKRFKQVSSVAYTVEPYDDPFDDGEPGLFIINVDKGKNEVVEEFTISEILESLRIYDGVYKRDQIDAAIKLKDNIIPHLIEILENVLAEPKKYAEDDNLTDQIYAVMLLGHFKESKAHRLVVDLFSLPDDLPHQIFGDLATSDLPVILLNTCEGSVGLIKSMILNKEVDDYCRVSACQALAYAVVEGYDSRESVIEFFGTLFTGKEAEEISDFWGLLAGIVCDLYPKEIMDVIKQAYELILPGMIQYSYFEKALELGKEKCLENVKIDLERDNLDDIHASMSWWACFNEESKSIPSSTGFENDYNPGYGYSLQPSSKSKKKKKKAKKKRRKQAKSSKKKNRR